MKIKENRKVEIIQFNLRLIHKLNRLFTELGLCKEDSNLKLSIIIVKKMIRWVTCEGLPGLKRFKAMSNLFNRRLMGIQEPVPFSRTHYRHFHKCLKLARHSNLASVYWISVFNCHRVVTLKPLYDTTTLTSGFKGSLFGLIRYSKSFFQVTSSFRSFVDQNWMATWKWHISGASGPNGQVAYTRYLDDLHAIRQDGLYWKICLFLYSLPLSNGGETFESLGNMGLGAWKLLYPRDKQPIHSRLAFLSDKSGKTRVVALVDILTQSCLKLVHQRCNRILRRLETDGTFDQDKQRIRVKKWTEDNVFLSSIDLTAATDRLPAIYQMLVLICSTILTPLQGFSWWLVTTKRSFVVKTPDGPKHIRYAVGQPMGALSSWPVMAISHHVLVWWSYKLAYPSKNPRFFSDYAILGDDLVIADKAVSEKYLLLIRLLGVDYSPEKSFFSNGSAEFAKSLFRRGKDLTPFPLGALEFRSNTVVSNVLALLSELSTRKCRIFRLSTLVGLYPTRWRNLVTLAALSPQSPKSVLDVQSRKEYGIFFSFLLSQKIKYFTRLNTVYNSTYAFSDNSPDKSGNMNPYYQIVLDNSERYPIRHLADRKLLRFPQLLVGLGWISYSKQSWPDGIPSIGDQNLVPGPTYAKERDDVFVRSSLLKLEKLLPGYFTRRCSNLQVGELSSIRPGGKPGGVSE